MQSLWRAHSVLRLETWVHAVDAARFERCRQAPAPIMSPRGDPGRADAFAASRNPDRLKDTQATQPVFRLRVSSTRTAPRPPVLRSRVKRPSRPDRTPAAPKLDRSPDGSVAGSRLAVALPSAACALPRHLIRADHAQTVDDWHSANPPSVGRTMILHRTARALDSARSHVPARATRTQPSVGCHQVVRARRAARCRSSTSAT